MSSIPAAAPVVCTGFTVPDPEEAAVPSGGRATELAAAALAEPVAVGFLRAAESALAIAPTLGDSRESLTLRCGGLGTTEASGEEPDPPPTGSK